MDSHITDKVKRQIQGSEALLMNKTDFILTKLESLANNYSQSYRSKVLELKRDIRQSKNIRELITYVGEGSTTITYLIDQNTIAILYGVKDKSELEASEKTAMLRKILVAIVANGISRVPQILGYSFEDWAIIFELASGKSLVHNRVGQSNNFTDEEISRLIQLVSKIHSRGLCLDYYPDNLIYDEGKGFSVIDLCLQKRKAVPLHRDVMALRFMMVGHKQDNDEEGKRRESLELGLRILEIVKKDFPSLFEDFQNDGDDVLTVGDKNVYMEFNLENQMDRKYLEKAKRFFKPSCL